MNISEILKGEIQELPLDEQKEVLGEMKKNSIFKISDTERKNLISFLYEKTDREVAIDYLFHVLDNEVSYPINDDEVKKLFSDDRMIEMKNLMMEKLQSDSSEEESGVSDNQ